MCDALPSKFFENTPGALHRTLALLISSLILLVLFLPLTWLGLLALGIASWLLGDRDSCSLVAFVTAGYSANALICSSVSGVHERYQARMTWLFMLVLIAVGVHLYRLRAYRVIPAASQTVERSVWHSARPPKGALPSDEILKRAIK
jgi:hypothetical protein